MFLAYFSHGEKSMSWTPGWLKRLICLNVSPPHKAMPRWWKVAKKVPWGDQRTYVSVHLCHIHTYQGIIAPSSMHTCRFNQLYTDDESCVFTLILPVNQNPHLFNAERVIIWLKFGQNKLLIKVTHALRLSGRQSNGIGVLAR